MTDSSFLTRLRLAREAATPEPWEMWDKRGEPVQRTYYDTTEHHPTSRPPSHHGLTNSEGSNFSPWTFEDTQLIALLVNNSAKIERLIEAVEAGEREWRWPDKGNIAEIRAALRALNENADG